MTLKQQPHTHQPTFRATPKKRAWHRRLTPAAWLLVALGGVLALGLALGLAKTVLGGRDTPFVLPPTLTPRSKATPTATSSPPTPTSEAWLPGPSAGSDAWWADQMRCDGADCIAPAAVISDVVAAYWDWREALPYYHDALEMTPPQLGRYYSGEMLAGQLAFLSYVQETGGEGETITEYDYETRVPQVAACSPDGLTCILGETVHGQPTRHQFDLTRRQFVTTTRLEEGFGGVNVWQFRYDPEEERWKIDRYLEWVPAPAP